LYHSFRSFAQTYNLQTKSYTSASRIYVADLDNKLQTGEKKNHLPMQQNNSRAQRVLPT
jgi:hypothetical protein